MPRLASGSPRRFWAILGLMMRRMLPSSMHCAFAQHASLALKGGRPEKHERLRLPARAPRRGVSYRSVSIAHVASCALLRCWVKVSHTASQIFICTHTCVLVYVYMRSHIGILQPSREWRPSGEPGRAAIHSFLLLVTRWYGPHGHRLAPSAGASPQASSWPRRRRSSDRRGGGEYHHRCSDDGVHADRR